MPKISELAYAGELGAANYILGIRDGVTVRFPVEVFQDEPIVNSSFTALTDTPSDYVDQAGKLAAVNSTETGLEFIDAPTSLPAGGTTGQVLTKNSAAEGDAGWDDLGIVGIPSGGVSGQVLAKNSGTDFDTTWVNQSGGSGSANDLTLVSGIYAHKNYGGF